MKNKKIVITFILSSSMLAFMYFAILFVYDPLKIFHKPWINKEYLQDDMRLQAASIINNWDYDSLIIGTSILENTSSKEASKELGGKFINISISGGQYFERLIILNYAFKKNHLKKILISLDDSDLTGVKKAARLEEVPTWSYLYDNNPFNDFKAYANNKYLGCLLFFADKKTCMGIKKDFDRPNAWYKVEHHAVRFGDINNWFKRKHDNRIKNEFIPTLETIKQIKLGNKIIDSNLKMHITESQKYIDENIIQYTLKYPSTEFIFIIPPYSRISSALDAQYNVGSFEVYKESLKYLVLKSEKFPNIKIYGWGNHAFVDNIANYKDLNHYDYKINSWMLSAIKNQEGQLTANNIDNYLDIFTNKALKYDLSDLAIMIDNYLKE